MRPTLAIAQLTLKAAFRYRLVNVLVVLLLGSVVALPMILKHDGTAQGFTQILLTYTLSLITTLLGFATLWLGCGTLAREVQECQIQMVVVKPIARWQIWLGKWLGIMTLNALLLAVSGGAVYFMLQWRANRLPPEVQMALRNEVLVARGSAKMPMPDIEPEVERLMQERLKQTTVAQMDRGFVRKQVQEQVKARYQLVPPGSVKPWLIDLGLARYTLKDQPLYLRVKFNAAAKSASGTFIGVWQVGPPETPRVWREQMNLAPETFTEFEIPPNLFDTNGVLTIFFMNPNDTAFIFSPDDGLEVLYKVGGFGANFVRGVGIIFCWLGLLASLGLAASSFLSFPVAAFASVAVLIVGLSSGTIAQVVQEGGVSGVNHDTGVIDTPTLVDFVLLPIFRQLLKLVNLVEGFSPVDSLSTGRSITWLELLQAFSQIVLLIGGILAAIGMISFSRRELATAQTQQ